MGVEREGKAGEGEEGEGRVMAGRKGGEGPRVYLYIFLRITYDPINISKITSRKTKWPRFFCLPGRSKVL